MDDLGEQIDSNRHKYSSGHNKIPIVIVEDHHHVVPFLHENIRNHHLPVEGNTLIHFDSHPDMQVPEGMLAERCTKSGLFVDDLCIENWIIPNCYNGIFKNLVWVKPPWAKQIKNKKNHLHVGECQETKLLKVDCRENYFLAEGNFQLANRMNNLRTLVLETLTLGKQLDSNSSDDYVEIKAISDRYVNVPIILDVDLDFFSTSNPFKNMDTEVDLYNRLRSIFKFVPPQSMSDEDISAAQNARQRQLTELKKYFEYLMEHSVMPPFEEVEPSQLYKEVSALCDAYNQTSPEIIPDWEIIFDAGMTIDDTELPFHVSTDDELKVMFQSFEKFLGMLRNPPRVITISRSSFDEYTPPDQVDTIQEEVLRILKKMFPCDIPLLKYSVSPELSSPQPCEAPPESKAGESSNET